MLWVDLTNINLVPPRNLLKEDLITIHYVGDPVMGEMGEMAIQLCNRSSVK